jgi:putative ABC transport system permease protein
VGICGIAWRNLGRNKRRSTLTMLALAFAGGLLLFTMSLQKGSYADMIRGTVSAQTGHLQILRKGYFPDREMVRYVHNPNKLIALAEALPGVKAVTVRINGAGLISKDEQTFGGLILGIDPTREAAFSTLHKTLVEGTFLQPDDRKGVLVGVGLAANLKAGIGDTIIFMGQGADGSIAAWPSSAVV